MAFKATPEQQKAIETNGNILVSAAAGSGKTAVLVERVIERLCSKTNAISADRLLIVTFTNAAAAEMRSRIEKRLDEELKANPNNLLLQRQHLLLSSAKICTIDSFCIDFIRENFEKNSRPAFKAVYLGFTGISPCIAHEICYRANVDSDKPTGDMALEEMNALVDAFWNVFQDIKEGDFRPNVVYENKQPNEYAAISLTSYEEEQTIYYDSMSELLEHYYSEKNLVTRIRQRSVDLRRIVQTALERNIKKYDLQVKQLQDTEKREKYRVYGELLNAYGYGLESGAKSMEALNYYTNEMITIPLDETLSAGENAKKYFDKYQKLKRTNEALTTLTQETKAEIEHLQSVNTSLDIALKEEDLVQIKEELIVSGYIRRKGGNKKEKITSKPFHYISSDGFDIYVGKNNLQNEELTFKFATGNDWWFHAKGIPGSHVIVKTNGAEMTDRAYEEAGRLAAYYSQARGQEKVEIDYMQKKNVKKPNGSKPGFVVYYTNYSLVIDSEISMLKLVE